MPYKSVWTILVVIFFDYLIAFGVIGLAGFAKKVVKNQPAALVIGSLAVCVLRYACHVISGFAVWSEWAPYYNMSVGSYVLIYNATFMIPETIVLCLAAFFIGQAIDLDKTPPERRKKGEESVRSFALRNTTFVLMTSAVIYCVLKLFSGMRDSSDRFDFTALGNQDFFFFLPIIVIAAFAVCLSFLFWRLSGVLHDHHDEKPKTDETDRESADT